MKLAALLIFTLSQQGYWFAEQDETIDVRWAIQDHLPRATLVWALRADSATVVSGKLEMPTDAAVAALKLKAPKARARTTLRLEYELLDAENKRLSSGHLS